MNRSDTMLVHATCVSIAGQGVLLRGEPGSGKSDLALRLIDQPGYGIGDTVLTARLIGDDQITLTRHGDRIVANAAKPLEGLLEIRGLGIVHCPFDNAATLALVVDLAPVATIERLPVADDTAFAAFGISVPRISVDASKASAPARVRAGLAAAQSGS